MLKYIYVICIKHVQIKFPALFICFFFIYSDIYELHYPSISKNKKTITFDNFYIIRRP